MKSSKKLALSSKLGAFVLVLVLVLGLLAACKGGGDSDNTSSTSSSSGATSSSSSSGGASSSSSSGGQPCTTIGCQSGVTIAFSFSEPGNYTFEVTVDGKLTTCNATLPLGNTTDACNSTDVLLTLSGSALPANQQSIGGLTLTTADAQSITLKGSREKALLGEKTYSPINYTVSSPNGPNCEPKECKQASLTFP